MSKLRIHLDCMPPTATAQQKGERIAWRGMRPFIVHYEKTKVKEAREMFCGLLAQYAPQEPLKGPVSVEAQWVFPWRKAERKGIIKEFCRKPKDTKPDIDNSNKLLLDCMTKVGILEDDSQVFSLNLQKYWGDFPGIWVEILHGEGLPAMPRKEVEQ